MADGGLADGEIAHWRLRDHTRWNPFVAWPSIVLFAVAVSAPGVANAQNGSGHPFNWTQFWIGMLALGAAFEIAVYLFLLHWIVEVAIHPSEVLFRRYGQKWRKVSSVQRVDLQNKRGTLRVSGRSISVSVSSTALADGVGEALLSQFGAACTEEARRALEDQSGKQELPPRQATLPVRPLDALGATPSLGAGEQPGDISTGSEPFRPGQREPTPAPRHRFWPAGMAARMSLMFLVVSLLAGGGLVLGGLLQTNSTAPFVTGIIILVGYLLFGVGFGNTFLAPVSIVENELRYRTFWWRRQSVPLQDITGIAMIWSRSGRWTAGFWGSHGRLQLLPGISASGGSGTVLERTRGGERVIALAQAIEAAQGPNGALLTRALQRGDEMEDAIWDPVTRRTRLRTGAGP